MFSVRILEMYTNQFETLVKLPKRANRVKTWVKNDVIEVKNESSGRLDERPQINYFAGPHCVFNPQVK